MLLVVLFVAVRENRTRGGRNKFGPIYRRDRALRRQLAMQRLHGSDSATMTPRSYFGSDKRMFLHDDFASLSQDEIDIKPSIEAVASLTAAHSPDSMFGCRQLWRDVDRPMGGCSYSTGRDAAAAQMSYGLVAHRQLGSGEVTDVVSRRFIDEMAATAAADTLAHHSSLDQEQSSPQMNIFHRPKQAYQSPTSTWQHYPSAAPGYCSTQQHGFQSSVSFSPTFSSQDVCSEFLQNPARDIPAEMLERSHRVQRSDGLAAGHHVQYSTPNVMVSQYPTVTSVPREQPGFTYHQRHRRHHSSHYSHYHPSPPQQLPSSLPQCPEVKQLQPDEPVTSQCSEGTSQEFVRSDGTSQEFISEADIAAQRLPVALKLINDLQRHDPRLCESVDQLRCYADELLQQLEIGSSLENTTSMVTQQVVIMACQLSDQALFVLVEWARHAHFFRQLPVRY